MSTNSQAVQATAVKMKRRKKRHFETQNEGYLFILPWILSFLILTLYPMVYSVYLSFTDYDLFHAPNWIGAKNYIKMFTRDRAFKSSMINTLKFVVMAVPLKLIFALFVATWLNKDVKGMSFYRTAIYLPSIIGGSVAVSILWKNIFGVDGYFNVILAAMNLPKVPFLSNVHLALPTIALMNVWQFGSSMIIFLSGLKNIPNSLYEAASIDGAGKAKQFFSITLPMLSPSIFFNLVYGMIGAFQQFNSAFLIGGPDGKPAGATYLYALMLYNKAFTKYDMGYASAMAWVLLIVIATLTAILFATQKFWVYYDE